MKIYKKIFLFVLLHICAISLFATDLSEIKLQWMDTKVMKLTAIVEIKNSHYKNGLIALEDYITWQEKLFQAKHDKLKIQHKYNTITQEQYLKNTLELSIDAVNFYTSQIANIKSLKEVGLLQGVDLKIFELYVLETYSNFQYILEEYKQTYPDKGLKIQLPTNLSVELQKIK